MPRKHCCATLSIVVHLTVTCGSTHTHTHTHTNTHTQNAFCVSTATMVTRTRHSVGYACIACLVITETKCVYWAVRTESFNVIRVNFVLYGAACCHVSTTAAGLTCCSCAVLSSLCRNSTTVRSKASGAFLRHD